MGFLCKCDSRPKRILAPTLAERYLDAENRCCVIGEKLPFPARLEETLQSILALPGGCGGDNADNPPTTFARWVIKCTSATLDAVHLLQPTAIPGGARQPRGGGEILA